MSKMYRTCPRCGAHLDHGERCDCESRKSPMNAAAEGKNAGKLATKERRSPALLPGA